MCSQKFFEGLEDRNIIENELLFDHLFLEMINNGLNPIIVYRSIITFEKYVEMCILV